LTKQNEKQNFERIVGSKAQENSSQMTGNSKKRFIEPEISVPVDVLEATTFFQAVTSGATN
jgi:hypothetical protein